MIWSSSSAPLAQQRRQDIAKMPMAKVKAASMRGLVLWRAGRCGVYCRSGDVSDERYVLVPVVATAEMMEMGELTLCNAGLADAMLDDASDCYSAMLSAAPPPDDAAIERVRAALEAQMEAQDGDDLPSSMHREQGRVWLEGWFDLPAAIAALCGGRVDG